MLHDHSDSAVLVSVAVNPVSAMLRPVDSTFEVAGRCVRRYSTGSSLSCTIFL